MVPVVAAFTVILLVGCGGRVGEVVSLNRSVPDEFVVVKRQPLTLPPDFALRPPAETDRNLQIAFADVRREAKLALFGSETARETLGGITSASLDEALDSSDQVLLDKAGAERSDPNIRRIVDQESTDLIRAKRTFVKELLSFIIDEEPPGKVLDSVDAERRVRQRLFISEQPGTQSQATIKHNADKDFDWSSLWPF
ncbi:MAG: DUF3035 domain-containing protein [Alphaproteobacteria bacterium]|nr:DUF3035 domain-containing protein [Alphaproteobacteria bacterium]